MALLTLTEAANLAARDRPWSVRLEFVGANPNNQCGLSRKFWYATGRGLGEPVEIGWGAIGAAPQTLLRTFDDFRDKVTEKLTEGYRYVIAPYQRMSAANLAQITAGVTATVPVYTPGPPNPAMQNPAPPPPAPGGGIAAPAVSPKIVTLAQQALGSPYDLIRSFRVKRLPASGVPSVIMMEALDVLGGVLLLMQVQEAVSFARDHVLDIQW